MVPLASYWRVKVTGNFSLLRCHPTQFRCTIYIKCTHRLHLWKYPHMSMFNHLVDYTNSCWWQAQILFSLFNKLFQHFFFSFFSTGTLFEFTSLNDIIISYCNISKHKIYKGYRDIMYYVCTPVYVRCRNTRNCIRSTKMCNGLKTCMNKWNSSNDCIHLKHQLQTLGNDVNVDQNPRRIIGLFFTAFHLF